MLAFVVGNTNFNFQRHDNRNTVKATRKLKSLAIETKKKMDRVVSLPPDACFEDSGIILEGEDIISQMENEYFYYDNIYDRVEVVKLISHLNLVKSDISKINFSNYNISYLVEKNTNFEKFNFTNYQELPIPLIIFEYCGKLRLIICMLTIASIPLIVLGRYLEFIREYQYIEKLDSKKKIPVLSAEILILIT
jgi:hypothetical protein